MDKKNMEKTIPTKKTRWSFLLISTVFVTVVWMISFFGVAGGTQTITFAEWTDFIKWAYGLYAVSEIGSKGAHAVLNRGE